MNNVTQESATSLEEGLAMRALRQKEAARKGKAQKVATRKEGKIVLNALPGDDEPKARKGQKVAKAVKSKAQKGATRTTAPKGEGSGALIRKYLREGKLKPKDILTKVLAAFPDHVTTVKDVYWNRWAMKAGRFNAEVA
ncbi:hypothetical protein KGP36_02320 [Patescibacteria group bacterium]|nr:hypothetical protein [Patescibacteria group bacterium]